MRSIRSGLVVSVLTMATCLAAAVAHAAEDQGVAQGRQMYLKYCSACHGPGGKGDGVVGAMMTPKAPDLTLIAKGNNGKFPFYEVMQAINGRSPDAQDQDTSIPGVPRAHGDPAMPVWGEIFSKDELSKGTSLDLQLQTTGKIMMITEFLQSIQAK